MLNDEEEMLVKELSGELRSLTVKMFQEMIEKTYPVDQTPSFETCREASTYLGKLWSAVSKEVYSTRIEVVW